MKEHLYPIEPIINAVKKNNPCADINIIASAFDFAEAVHKNQLRDEGLPYIIHPYRVALYMAEDMKIGDADIIAAALLHDVMEDGDGVDFDLMSKKFGTRIAKWVSDLSKPPREKFNSKEERNNAYYKHIQNCSDEVKLIKISDRLDNIRYLHMSQDRRKKERYVNETKEHYLPIAQKLYPQAASEMKNILATLEEILLSQP